MSWILFVVGGLVNGYLGLIKNAANHGGKVVWDQVSIIAMALSIGLGVLIYGGILWAIFSWWLKWL